VFRSSLFQHGMVDDYFVNLRKTMCGEIDRIPAREIAQADADRLASDYSEKYQVACPALGNDISYDEPPFSASSDSAVVTVYVPFTGNHELFQCTGGSAPVITQEITVQPDQLVIPMRVEQSRIGELPEQVTALCKRIEEGLASIEQKLRFFNPDLKRWALQRIRERQAEIARHERTLGDLQKSGFSLRRRNDGNEKLIVPVKPKVIAVQPRPSRPSQEPELALADYDEILDVIRSMVAVFERSPSVFKTMEEEHLRTILLVALNGIFKGDATGETFNGIGDTDILIRVNDNNIFIAECLIWDGPEHFRKKLTEQLFRYSTWRDSKLAAIVFNRRRNFSSVVQKMREVAAGLSNRIADLPYPAPTGCRHRLRRDDDPQKQFILTCLAFEVPS
jgi:hypothetical protein